MQGSMQFKRALLKSLLLGLRERGVASREMGFLERKRAIRRAADAALVSARGSDATRWSQALETQCRPSTSKRVLRRCHRPRPRKAGTAARPRGSAGVVARAMLRKRTQVLKGIVPGVQAVDDECTLLGEALDYAVCLKAQVDVMQLLVRALQAPKQ
ncbi:transcription factor IBH1-like 1 [Triticum dicoccoides]|nr:transcription factor IBH1-like 1 [Triticum dicoccoides]XP_044406838.1 transcription factor IBH1-like 1 [Triticum aestivum]VAI50574.1 unnamed protein product [Triticum turgidum subsp. durum]